MDRSPGISVGLLVVGSSSGVVAVELKSESGELGVVTSCCSSGVNGLASEPLIAAVATGFAAKRSEELRVEPRADTVLRLDGVAVGCILELKAKRKHAVMYECVSVKMNRSEHWLTLTA